MPFTNLKFNLVIMITLEHSRALIEYREISLCTGKSRAVIRGLNIAKGRGVLRVRLVN